MNDPKFAFVIENHVTYRLACAVWPHLEELTFEQVRNNFLVFDDKDRQFALYSPGAAAENFRHIEDGPQITLKKVTLTE